MVVTSEETMNPLPGKWLTTFFKAGERNVDPVEAVAQAADVDLELADITLDVVDIGLETGDARFHATRCAIAAAGLQAERIAL